MSIPSNAYVSVSFVDDSEIKKLNKKHRNKDEVTDVLSFNIDENLPAEAGTEDRKYYLGDVIVNTEQAARQAKEYDNSTEQEISDLVSHGMLHLLGVHHDGDEN